MNKTWLITGVSSGFGYEMTKQFLEKGDNVVGTVRNKDKVKEFIEKYPDAFDCRILDVTDVPAVHSTVGSAFEKHGKKFSRYAADYHGISAVVTNERNFIYEK